jgi:hypothetical protein
LNPGNDWSHSGELQRCCVTALSDDEKKYISQNYLFDPHLFQEQDVRKIYVFLVQEKSMIASEEHTTLTGFPQISQELLYH